MRPQMDDGGAVYGSRADAQKRHEHIARVLIGEQGDDLFFLQALHHGPRRVAPIEDLRAAVRARIRQYFVGFGIVGFAGYDIERIAVQVEPAGQKLPVAEMPRDEQHALPHFESAAHMFLAVNRDQARPLPPELICGSFRNSAAVSPKFLNTSTGHLMPRPLIQFPPINEIEIFQGHAAVAAKRIKQSASHPSAKRARQRQRQSAQRPNDQAHSDAPRRALGALAQGQSVVEWLARFPES